MEQYEKSGPPPDPNKIKTIGPKHTEDLAGLIDQQDQRIRDLEREVRKLRTDLRMAINSFNSAKSNG